MIDNSQHVIQRKLEQAPRYYARNYTLIRYATVRRIRQLISLYSFNFEKERSRERKMRGMDAAVGAVKGECVNIVNARYRRYYRVSSVEADLFRGKFEISVEPLLIIAMWAVLDRTLCYVIIGRDANLKFSSNCHLQIRSTIKRIILLDFFVLIHMELINLFRSNFTKIKVLCFNCTFLPM